MQTSSRAKTEKPRRGQYQTSIDYWRRKRKWKWTEMAARISVNHNVLLRSAKAAYSVYEAQDGQMIALGPKQTKAGGLLATGKLDQLASEVGVSLRELLSPPEQGEQE